MSNNLLFLVQVIQIGFDINNESFFAHALYWQSIRYVTLEARKNSAIISVRARKKTCSHSAVALASNLEKKLSRATLIKSKQTYSEQVMITETVRIIPYPSHSVTL